MSPRPVTPLSVSQVYSPTADGAVVVRVSVLTISLSPLVAVTMVTPLVPDTSGMEAGSSHVMLGLGRPEALQLKETGLGAVMVAFSGGWMMLAATDINKRRFNQLLGDMISLLTLDTEIKLPLSHSS